jgi:hypothetical protein
MLLYCGATSGCGCIVETQEECVLGGQDAGVPHSNDPEEAMKGELLVGVTPSGWSPVTWIPVKRGPEGSEAKGRGLNIKPNETRPPFQE